MKVTTAVNNEFKPFDITITFENEEEALSFMILMQNTAIYEYFEKFNIDVSMISRSIACENEIDITRDIYKEISNHLCNTIKLL